MMFKTSIKVRQASKAAIFQKISLFIETCPAASAICNETFETLLEGGIPSTTDAFAAFSKTFQIDCKLKSSYDRPSLIVGGKAALIFHS